ncbi:MAG: hypothetical protein EOO38_04830 [Cytophagaceae bacterium]|nr:MAG: hypothetical protein EOO38_04830 [Cytophagaceae bacterium]
MQASRTTLVGGLDKLVARPLEHLQDKLSELSDKGEGSSVQEITSCLQILRAANSALKDLRCEAEAHEIKSAATGLAVHAPHHENPGDEHGSST